LTVNCRELIGFLFVA